MQLFDTICLYANKYKKAQKDIKILEKEILRLQGVVEDLEQRINHQSRKKVI